MKRKIQVAVSAIIGIALVWWLFRSVDFRELSGTLAGAHWGWLLASQLAVLASFVTRIFRWRYIVNATANASFRGMFTSTQIGFLANFTLPMRLGEFIRAIALTRIEGIPFSKSIALAGLDRVTDIFGLIVVMGVALIGFPMDRSVVLPKTAFEGMTEDIRLEPALIQSGAAGIGISLLVLIVVLAMLYVNQNRVYRMHDAVIRVLTRLAGKVSVRLAHLIELLGAKTGGMLHDFSGGLHVFRSPGDMIKSIAWSLVTWGLFMFCTYCFMRSLSIESPWYGVFVVQTCVAVWTSVVVTPGAIGQFHLGIILGVLVAVPDIPIPVAYALAVLAHGFNFLPVVIVGVLCLMLERNRLAKIPTLADVDAFEAGRQT